MSSIGIIILAAGASTRMGTPKQLLLYQGRSFLHHITEMAVASKCYPIVVVLGASANQIISEVNSLPIHIAINRYWEDGMGRSIQVGIATLMSQSPHVEAAIVLLCDQPFLSMSFIHQLIATYHSTQQPIVASSYTGILGVPALFHRRLFPALLALNADQGAKYLIQKYASDVACVPFDEGAIDVDTPEDYQQLQVGLKTCPRDYFLNISSSKR